MSEPSSAESIILKILSGVQAGAEVSLPPGEYTIGSGDSDDIQLIDVSLKPAQGRLRIGRGKIEITGGAGGVVTANGLAVEAGSDTWQEIEPLDIITAGTIRFALGPPSANWTTLTAPEEKPQAPRSKTQSRLPPLLALARSFPVGSLARLIAPTFIVALLAAAGYVGWYLSIGTHRIAPMAERDDAAVVRSLLDEYPFGKSVVVRREVDGTIYATGFVETNVERRALAGAIDKSGIPVRLRLGVLESLRTEIAGLIAVGNVPVTFTLSASGELTLDGLILREDDLTKFLDQLKDSIIGLNKITSNIRTAKSLLSDLTELANGMHIAPWVLFRLDGNLIEASGSLPDEKKDAWLRFLQAYSRRYSKDIALRSLVHLQNVDGGDPLTFDRDMLERIARGEVDPNELLSGTRRSAAAPQRAQVAAEAALPRSMPGNAKALQSTLRTWESVRADLSQLDRMQIVKKYLNQETLAQPESCRPDSRLTAANLPQALFWLDLLSVSSEMSLVKFSANEQAYILEAALDPTLVSDCLARLHVHTDNPSLYAAEAATNPDFVRFVTRDFPVYGNDITGASLTASRYIQLRDGKKMREGAPPANAIELSIVGELGIAVAGKEGYSIALYGPQINWMGRSSAAYGSHGNWIWN